MSDDKCNLLPLGILLGSTIGSYWLYNKYRSRFCDDIPIIRLDGEIGDNTEKAIVECIRKIPLESEIKLVLTTPGGFTDNIQVILRLLLNHQGGYVAYIRNRAMSGGTIIALGAKEIVMDDYSFLGKIDPIIRLLKNDYYMHSVIKQTNKNYDKEICKYYLNLTNDLVDMTFYSSQVKDEIKKEMIYSEYPHCRVFGFTDSQKIGLNVRRPSDAELRLFR